MSLGRSQRHTLAHLIALVDREDHHLLAVRDRLLDNDYNVDTSRFARLITDDIGIDRLESFGAKFARMQDTVVDKQRPMCASHAR